MSALFLNGVQHWSCPNCTVTEVTQGQPNRFHECAGLNGLTAPLVIDGTDCKVEAREREDYIGNENVGRFMSVVTTRADGSNDTAVFAPTASVFST